MNSSSPGPRLDVHAHFLPDFYREAAQAAGLAQPDAGVPAWPDWSEAAALATMDRLGIGTALLSISSPGVHFGDDAAAGRLARQVNEAGADLVRRHPARFGLFAALPLPDVARARAEVAYAYDTLGTDGILLETNNRGTYLGDPTMEPLLADLHARQAVVLLHPTAPPNTDAVRLDYPTPLLEFMFDTTRCVSQLLLRRVPQRYPGIRWIVPHAGAALPLLLDRVAGLSATLHLDAPSETELYATFRSFYFDLAGTPLPRTLPALRSLADSGHLLYGSDYCFAPEALVAAWQGHLDRDLTTTGEWASVMQTNALALFPRVAALTRAAA